MAADQGRRIIDLSHEIVDGMTTHPGIPAPSISAFLTHEASKCPVRAGHDVRDRPDRSRRQHRDLHRHARASISRRSGSGRPGAGARRRHRRGPGRSPWRDGAGHRAVGIRWRRRPRASRPRGHRLGRALGNARVPQRQPVPDRRRRRVAGRRRRGAHRHRLAQRRFTRPIRSGRPTPRSSGAGIPLVEHLTGLGALPPSGWRFYAVPPRIRGMATFPIRAFAIVG